MSRAEGVTVLTLTSDPDSRWPPLCQILKGLCYSPACCSLSQPLRKLLGTSQLWLGVLHIMIGMLQGGFVFILLLTYSMNHFYINVMFGIASVSFHLGTTCIISEKFPCLCLDIINVIFNLAGVAVAALVSCSLLIGWIYPCVSCGNIDFYWSYRRTTPSPGPDAQYIKEKCLEAKALDKMLMRGIAGVLIVLSAVELCVSISAAVLGIKALKRTAKKQDKTPDEPKLYKSFPGGCRD